MTKNTPTNVQIDAVLKYLPLLKQPGFVPSTRYGCKKDEDGVISLPMEQNSPEIDNLMSDLYDNGFIESFDWSSWQDTASLYVEEPKRLAEADLDTLKKLLTTHARKDRFCEGHFSAMVKCGHIAAVLERLAELRAEAKSQKS